MRNCCFCAVRNKTYFGESSANVQDNQVRMFHIIFLHINQHSIIIQIGYFIVEEFQFTKRMKLSNDKISQIINFFKTSFLKSSIENSTVQALLQSAEVLEPEPHTIIFQQGEQILDYYFLIRGIVGLHKNIKVQNKTDALSDEIQLIQNGKVIGQYFNSLHNLREYSAEVKVQCTQVIKIPKKVFDSCCQQLIMQYGEVDKYAKEILHVSKKIDSFELFTIRKYRLGSSIKLNIDQIGVIFKGQCKITYKIQNKVSKSPTKTNLPAIMLPHIMNNRQSTKQIVLISQNQWIFTQHLQEEFQKNPKFKYLVTSQNAIILVMPISKIDLLPLTKVQMLKRVSCDRKNKVQSVNKETMKQKNEGQILNSPRQLKGRMNEAHKILQKLDPNINPNLILQKYKLGYNPIRYEQNEAIDRVPRNSFAPQTNMMRIERSERRLKPQFYKVKDWSQYVKIPNLNL